MPDGLDLSGQGTVAERGAMTAVHGWNGGPVRVLRDTGRGLLLADQSDAHARQQAGVPQPRYGGAGHGDDAIRREAEAALAAMGYHQEGSWQWDADGDRWAVRLRETAPLMGEMAQCGWPEAGEPGYRAAGSSDGEVSADET